MKTARDFGDIFKKVVVLPSAIALITVMATPFIGNIKKVNSSTSNNNSGNKNTTVSNKSIIDSILKSLQSNVFAESDAYGCWNASFGNTSAPCDASDSTAEYCFIEKTIGNTMSYRLQSTLDYTDAGASVSQTSGTTVTLTPTNQTFSGADHTFTTSFDAPAEPGTAGENLVFHFTATFNRSSGTASTNVLATAHIAHLNVAPTPVTYSPASYELDKTTLPGIRNLDVSVTFHDPDNSLNIAFDLSSASDFSSILQTQTYNGIAPDGSGNETQTHTFTNLQNLSNGTYYWRARAIQVNPPISCQGFATEVDPDPSVTVASGNALVIISSSVLSQTGAEALPFVYAGSGLFASIGILNVGKFLRKRKTQK